MNEAVLTNALVPLYSTKRSGTGLRLALARAIAEAHGGRITLGNREGGGLTVALILPACPPGVWSEGLLYSSRHSARALASRPPHRLDDSCVAL
ncbi:ATP-binding protein [Massilia sp. TWR1-2-2]|uniref:ATP-binding protein n=1 Tax=Massilia sp. TWR1-2-2 TaxID=2804584 RepID=UPI003CF9833C